MESPYAASTKIIEYTKGDQPIEFKGSVIDQFHRTRWLFATTFLLDIVKLARDRPELGPTILQLLRSFANLEIAMRNIII